jgi:phosphatidylglycerol:prolipoprotein diacylglycerol transferase
MLRYPERKAMVDPATAQGEGPPPFPQGFRRLVMFVIPFPAVDPVAIKIGPFAIRWYGLAYFAGILIGWWYARRLVSNGRLWGGASPITVTDIDDFLLWLVVGIVGGGRIGYALFYQPGHFLDDPLAMFRLWEGGMSFHGGLAGTILAMTIFSLRRKIPMLSLFDVCAASVTFGLFFGRIANFINSELWGRPTNVPWAIIFPNGGPLPRHPSQLYEAGLEGLLLFIVLRVLTHHFLSLRRPGLTGGAFIAGYGLARIAVEFVREPDPQLGFLAGGLTMGMALSLPMVAVGVAAMIYALRRRTA